MKNYQKLKIISPAGGLIVQVACLLLDMVIKVKGF